MYIYLQSSSRLSYYYITHNYCEPRNGSFFVYKGQNEGYFRCDNDYKYLTTSGPIIYDSTVQTRTGGFTHRGIRP